MLDVLHGLVDVQEDGLVAVVQAGGGTLRTCTEHGENKASG